MVNPDNSAPPVPAEIAGELRLIVGCFADEIRARGCSPEVAVWVTLTAVQMLLADWRADADDLPQVVTDPSRWNR